MKISKGRLKKIIQEEMERVEEEPVQEQITPDNIMLAIEAIGKVLSTPGVKEAALGGVLMVAMQYLQKYADKDAEVMADRPEIAPEEM